MGVRSRQALCSASMSAPPAPPLFPARGAWGKCACLEGRGQEETKTIWALPTLHALQTLALLEYEYRQVYGCMYVVADPIQPLHSPDLHLSPLPVAPTRFLPLSFTHAVPLAKKGLPPTPFLPILQNSKSPPSPESPLDLLSIGLCPLPLFRSFLDHPLSRTV